MSLYFTNESFCECLLHVIPEEKQWKSHVQQGPQQKIKLIKKFRVFGEAERDKAHWEILQNRQKP